MTPPVRPAPSGSSAQPGQLESSAPLRPPGSNGRGRAAEASNDPGAEPAGGRSNPSFGYSDYLRFSKLMHVRFGLNFSEKRFADLEQGIRRAFAASTCVDLDEYYDLLQDEREGAMERERLINALTVSESHFFRDANQFDALYNQVLPQIIERRRSLRTLRIWSAGCAGGEEPYSIAIALRQLLPDVDEWAITILGTDVNSESLDRARKAVYGDWAFREDRAKWWRAHYFRPLGNRYELIPEVRRMVTLAHLNLAEDGYPAYETNTTYMDLILCRNVTIYFSELVTHQVIGRFYDALVDGGWLVVGHAEHALGMYHRFQARNFPGAILYQRTGEPTTYPADWEWLTAPPPRPDPPPMVTRSTQPATRTTASPTSVKAPPARALPSPGENPIERAQELLSYGHSEQARDLLLQVVDQRLEHVTACALLGQAYANLGCWAEAEQWCSRAVALDRLALEAYYTLALVFQHQGKLDRAIDAMKKVIYIDRNYVLGHFGLADLYRSNGQLPHAFKSLDNVRRLLDVHADAELIPESGGITAGRLRQAVIHQQQRWESEASAGKVKLELRDGEPK
jgi:chemotaxis protein methyltransferase CheR